MISKIFKTITAAAATVRNPFKMKNKTDAISEKALIGQNVAPKTENEHLKKMVDDYGKKLDEAYTNKNNLPYYQQKALKLRAEGKIEEAVTEASEGAGKTDKETAERHIFTAELYIINRRFDDAEKHFKQAAAVFPSYDTNFATAQFYYDLNKFHEAIAYYQKCLNFEIPQQNRAGVLNNMGNAQCNNRAFPAAEISYREALTIRRALAAKAYLPDVTTTLDSLGISHHKDKNEKTGAETYRRENPAIRKEPAARNREAWLPDVAITLTNLGNLHWKKNEYSTAETFYQEALIIRKKLAVKNPETHLPNVANTLNNLGVLHHDRNEYPQAEASYKDALKTYKELTVRNPDVYLPYVAVTLNNLGILHKDQNEYPAAEASYKEALTLRKELAAKNPETYLPHVAETLVNLSIFYQDYVPRKKLSLRYARETKKAARKCHPAPEVRKYLGQAKQVIEDWK